MRPEGQVKFSIILKHRKNLSVCQRQWSNISNLIWWERIIESSHELNPDFLFSLTRGQLLVKIAKGEIDAVAYVKKELINRGTGKKGKWAGFPEAARQWLMPVKKPIVFDSAYVLDAWKEETTLGFIEYIKLKNGVLVTVTENGISVYDAADLEVPGSAVEFKNISTREKPE